MSRAYYVIDSIKGGCGKTTFSIMLSQFLQSEKQENITCLLDFDFLGTGLLDIFLNDVEKERFNNEYIFITEKIRGFHAEGRKYIYKHEVQGKIFYIGFGEPQYRARSAYALSSEFNYTPVTSYGVFRNGIQSILKESLEGNLESQIFRDDKEKVENIVMDMSPGMDAYSEVVKGCIFDKRHSQFIDQESKRYYFLMMGMDPSHISAAKNYFQTFMNGDDKIPDKIFVVINDIQLMAPSAAEHHSETVEQCYEAMIDLFKTGIRLNDENQKKIYFLVLNHYDNYTLNLHLCQPIGAVDDIFDVKPFRFWSSWKNAKVQEVNGDEEWLKEILNEDDK